jgi:hypothetical protein
MRQSIILAIVILAALVFATTPAAAGNGYGQTDDWSGFRWARDDDGDGIPNGLDPDWTRPRDGSGYGIIAFIGPSLIGALEQHQNRHEWQYEKRTGTRSLADAIRECTRSRDRSCKD